MKVDQKKIKVQWRIDTLAKIRQSIEFDRSGNKLVLNAEESKRIAEINAEIANLSQRIVPEHPKVPH